jgi:hypothetical protein
MTPDVTSSRPAGPLADVRVVEVSTGRVGRIAGMLLADQVRRRAHRRRTWTPGAAAGAG